MRTIYFLSLLLLVNSIFAKEVNGIKIESKYVVDWNTTLDLSTLNSKKFHPFVNKKLSIGYNNHATIWCFFKLKNTDSKNYQNIWLCFDNNHIDSLVIYNGNKIEILGDRTKFSSPFMKGQCFGITLLPNENKTLFVKLKKEISFFEFAYSFENESALILDTIRQISFISIFLGCIFFLMLFNLNLYYLTRDFLYLRYIFYSILTVLYILTITSYLKTILFNEFLYFSELQIYSICFWVISLGYFITAFLDLKINQPIKHTIILYLNRGILLTVLGSFYLVYSNRSEVLHTLFFIIYGLFMAVFGTIVFAAIANYRKDKQKSLYVLVAFLPNFIWGTLFVLKSFRVVGTDFHEDLVVYIGLYEIILFGYVLTKNYVETFQKNNALNLQIIAEKQKSIQVITQVQIKERRTVSDIIHDNLGSKIAHIMQLIELKKSVSAYKNLEELAKDIREISHSILPKSLDEGILIGSLQNQINIINSGMSNVKIEFFNYGLPEKITEKWVFDLYLISLELINNAKKHGKASAILIEFFDYENSYGFQFSDNGIGFKTETFKKGFGLENIEKRILNYKGSFEINSIENEGTVVQINLPK